MRAFFLAVEDFFRFFVGKSFFAFNERADDFGGDEIAFLVEVHEDGDGEPDDIRRRLQRSFGELFGEHRDACAREVGGVAAAGSFYIQREPSPYIVGDIGDVDA